MDEEEQLFQQTVEWLPSKLSTTPVFMKQQVAEFQIDPFTRIFINDKGEKVYLTTKEFDLLYFLFCHRGQIFTKEHLYESVWGYDNEIDGSNLTSFIRKLRKKKMCIRDRSLTVSKHHHNTSDISCPFSQTITGLFPVPLLMRFSARCRSL